MDVPYSNSEMSEEFLKQNIMTLKESKFLEVLKVLYMEQVQQVEQ